MRTFKASDTISTCIFRNLNLFMGQPYFRSLSLEVSDVSRTPRHY
jgi:hypothetical protein